MGIPDADVHSVATGPAKHIVDAHQDPQEVQLYGSWFCPFVQRTWAILEEKGIPYQYIEVNPYHKPKSLLDLNPRGLVPTLGYKQKPLYESVVIGEFLEDAYPDHGKALRPADPYQRAKTRLWTDYCTSRIIPSWHRFLQCQGGKGELEELRKEFLGHLLAFTKEMDAEGPWFDGKEIGMVDLVVAPWAMRTWVFDHFKGGSGIPKPGEGGDDQKTWNRWHKWIEAIGERPSIKDTTSDREHYIPIYQRYADDQAQSELAKATRKGRGVP